MNGTSRLTAATLAVFLASVPTAPVLHAQTSDPVAAVADQGLYDDPDAPVLGNPQGDVTIVEFFDYQCPFCRKLAPDLARLIQEDTNVRLVLRDWPILSATSKVAARAALAAGYQDKYPQAHAALFAVAGRLDKDKIDEVLKTAGIDLDRLRADALTHEQEIETLLSRTDLLASALGLNGTPGLVIGPSLAAGSPSYEELTQAIRRARARTHANGSD
ncbi:DsbA family protein [Nostoc sp. NIES-2111]